MMSTFVWNILQTLTWINIIANLVFIFPAFLPRDGPRKFVVELLARPKTLWIISVIWPIPFLLFPLFVPSEYQIELFVTLLRNFGIVLLPLSPMAYLVMSWWLSKLEKVSHKELT